MEFSDLKNKFCALKYKDTNSGLKNKNNPVNLTIFHFIINKNNKILSNKQRLEISHQVRKAQDIT